MKYCYFLLLIFFFFACKKKDPYGGKQIFRYNLAEGITSLDPAFARSLDNVSATNQLFNGLLQTDSNLNLVPCIAKKWEILDRGKRYRFIIRDDVLFHAHPIFGEDSSRHVVAEDFVYSFNRLIDPSLLSPGKWVMNEVERISQNKLKVIAVNDTTLDIYLERSFQPFLGILSMQYCSVVPKEAIEYFDDEFRSNPIGTGPFRFKYWKENSKLIFLKNPNFFERDELGRQLPFLDAVAISFIKDEEVAFLKFLKGDFDYLSGLKGSYKDDLMTRDGRLRTEYDGQIDFSSSPYLNTEYLGFYLDSNQTEDENPLVNPLLRKAINYGFDRQKMLTYLRNGIGSPANQGFVPQGLPSFTEKINGYSFQPDSVKALLKRANYPNGEGLPPIILSTTAQYLDICEYLQSSLSSFGIELKVEVNQAATNNELIANGEVNFFRKSWVADYPDAENYLALFKSENFSPRGPNYTHFSNTFYDQWYDSAIHIPSDSERYQLYQKMDSLIMEEVPIVSLFYDRLVRFTHKNISDITVNPMNLLVLKYAKKEGKS